MRELRAFRLVGLNRSGLNYRPKRPDESGVCERLCELVPERRRFGYWRLGWLLARDGHVMNRKNLHRIYREESSWYAGVDGATSSSSPSIAACATKA